MPAIYETAYPRLKEGMTPAELAEVYIPTAGELALAMSTSTRGGARLGYFAPVGDLPKPIVRHIARCLGTDHRPERRLSYDGSGMRRRRIPIIRAFLDVRPFNGEARALVAAVVREAAQTEDDLADLMNLAIEELVRNRAAVALLQESPPDAVRAPGRDPTRHDRPGYDGRGRPRIPVPELDQPPRSARTRPALPPHLSWIPAGGGRSSRDSPIATASPPGSTAGTSRPLTSRRSSANSGPVTSASRGATGTRTIAASSCRGRNMRGMWPGTEYRPACRWRAVRS
jgi:hypothetical protein